jgi:hypothetical protein
LNRDWRQAVSQVTRNDGINQRWNANRQSIAELYGATVRRAVPPIQDYSSKALYVESLAGQAIAL